MATSRDNLDLRIRALVEGVKEVEQLAGEVQDLQQQADKPVRDSTRQYRQGIQRSRQVTDRFQRSVGQLRTGLGAVAGILGAQAIGRQLVQTANRLENVGRQARSLGADIEVFQELAFAVKQYGGQTSDLTDALGTLSDRSQDAIAGQESFIEDFELLGVAVEDLRDKRPDELFRLMAERVAQIEEPQRRVAGVVRIFGDDLGQRLLPLLRQGAEGLDEYAASAREVDAVHTEEGIERAAEAARTMREVRNTVDAQWAEVVTENAEALGALAEGFGTIVRWAGEAASAVGTFGESLGYLAARITQGPIGLEDQLRAAQDDLERLQSRAERQRSELEKDLPDITREELQVGLDETLQKIEQTENRIENLREAMNFSPPDTGGGSGDDGGDDLGGDGDTGDTGDSGTGDDRADRIQRIIDKLREQRATYGQAAEATALYRLRTLGASEAQLEEARSIAQGLEVLRATEKTEEAIAEQREEEAKAARERQEQREQRIESDRELLQQLEREIELEGMAARERAQAEAVARLSTEATDRQREAVRRLAGELYDLRDAADETGDEMSEFAKQAARNAQDAFADFLFDPFSEGLDGMLDGFVRTLRRMAAEGAAEQILGNLGGDDGLAGIFENIGSALNSSGSSGSGGSGGGFGDMIGSILGSFFHDGGIAGQGTDRRPVPVAAFANAPRLHGGGVAGLRSDEVPAVLQSGEEVLTQDDPRHRSNAGSTGYTVVQNIQTPNASSFRKSQTQIAREARRGLDKGR